MRRSVGAIKHKGAAREIREGDTKTAWLRTIDIDPDTVAVLRAWKRERGLMALHLAQDQALAFGNHEGQFRDPETFSKVFKSTQRRCAQALGDAALPEIRLHDLRHAHATILLTAREPVHVVSQRLGHMSAVVTMTVYAHVLPGNQRETADRLPPWSGVPSHEPEAASISLASRALRSGNYTPLTCADAVRAGGFELPFRWRRRGTCNSIHASSRTYHALFALPGYARDCIADHPRR